jgi:acetyl-CoA carboxylase biotin carboxyl carrier protein
MTQKNGKPGDPGQESPFKSKIDYEEVKKLIALLEEKNLTEFELEVEGFKIKLSRQLSAPAQPSTLIFPGVRSAGSPEASPAGQELPGATAPAPLEDKNIHYISSPMVGTFYRAPSPSSPAFVEIGDTVKKGQTLCIIEAMKLMNEIESDVSGIVTDILVENGKPVEYGQRLFAVKAGA